MDGQFLVWGDNENGQLGIGQGNQLLTPSLYIAILCLWSFCL